MHQQTDKTAQPVRGDRNSFHRIECVVSTSQSVEQCGRYMCIVNSVSCASALLAEWYKAVSITVLEYSATILLTLLFPLLTPSIVAARGILRTEASRHDGATSRRNHLFGASVRQTGGHLAENSIFRGGCSVLLRGAPRHRCGCGGANDLHN